jgi:hypothetical protein
MYYKNICKYLNKSFYLKIKNNSFTWPFFFAIAILFIFLPLSYIFSSIFRFISSISMCFSFVPFSFINISIAMIQSALPVKKPLLIKSFIRAAVLPFLFTKSFFKTILIKFSYIFNSFL